jgi:ribosome-associated protein
MGDSENEFEFDGPSKSQLKRESNALQEIGEELVNMPEGKLKKFDLPENLKDAVYEARRLRSREAKRRHLQFIGKLMRICDVESIKISLDKINHQSLTYRQHFETLELWRDDIINQGGTAIDKFLTEYPSADRQKLRNLQRQANREAELKKTPNAKRKLFEYLKILSD